MKIRWREHEAVLINITAAVLICKYGFDTIRLSAFTASYFTGTLIPQIGTVVLAWVCYFWMNRIVIPGLTTAKRGITRILFAILQVFIIAYLLGPVINFASFYLNASHGSETINLPFTFGQHPQPFLNTFGGLDMSLFLLFIYLLYAVVREQAIHYLQEENKGSALTVAVVNECTLFFLRLLALPILTGVFNLVQETIYYNIYYACLLPTQAVFLTNKFYLFPLRGNRSFFVWRTAGPILFFSFVYTVMFSPALGEYWSFLNVSLIWALQVFFVVPISWLDFKQETDKILKLRGLEKALTTSKADLQLLRMQINPHFLFNVLNTIYGTALIEGAHRTAESTQKLGEMMRFMIHENTRDYIDLDKEVAYLRNYIDIQKLRIQLSPDICIEDRIDYESSTLQIVPMLLIPLVENAFKHGIDLNEKSFIKIHLCIAEGVLNYEVTNSIHKLRAQDYEKGNSGIGLNLVKQRLTESYLGRNEFSYGPRDKEFVCKLSVELEPIMIKEKC